jgi:hypothetical protein
MQPDPPTGVDDDRGGGVPRGDSGLSLDAYPNPFNPTVTIRFNVPESGHVALRIYDVRGKLVRTLAEGRMRSGTHVARWDGRNSRDVVVASGVYFVTVHSAGGPVTKSVVLLE